LSWLGGNHRKSINSGQEIVLLEIGVQFLTDVLLESVVFVFDSGEAVRLRLVLPVLEIDETSLELLLVFELAFDDVGIRRDNL
jgi:hypothetical protein